MKETYFLFVFCFKLGFTHVRLTSYYKAWSYKKKNHKTTESSCARKETVDIDILVTSRNGDRKIMQSIRITSRTPSRIRK